MYIGAVISALPSWALFVLVMVVCVLAAELGAWMAKRRAKKGIKDPEAPIGTAVGAILGLLAFMLGFTFSLTESRFGNRKEQVIEQAKAINTCYLRANLIPEKQKKAIRKALREYINILVHKDLKSISYQNKVNKNAIARLEELHSQMWQQASTLVNEDLDGEIRTFFLGSLNDVINIYQERKTITLIFRIPDIIWTSLFLLTMIGTFVVGYQTGIFGTRRIISLPFMAAAFALVIVMIADMDSTGPDRFQVSQQPLIDIKELIEKDNP
jgi:uncharacterized protein YneF (UPF0154 family)